MSHFPFNSVKIFVNCTVFNVYLDCEIGYHSIAVIILRFFCALPDSLIPSISFERCIQAAKMSETTVQVPIFVFIKLSL